MAGAVSLALTPAPLLIALGLVLLGPPALQRFARWVTRAGLAATIGFLAGDAAPVLAGGRVLASFGSAMPGVPYLFRSDGVAVTAAFVSAAAALLIVRQRPPLEPQRQAALLLCVLGSVIAAFAGNAVMLFAGVEFANLGVFLLLRGQGRPGRGAVAALAVEHAGALGLLAAAANLQVTTGTSDFSALPAGAVTAAVAVPWGLAAVVRLLAPAVMPVRTAMATATWAATAAVPAGALMLVRLREATGGSPPLAGTITLAAVGTAIGAAGAAMVARRRGSPTLAGRGLCLAVAGNVIALAGFPEALAATAIAAGLGALELTVAASAAWEQPGAGGPGRAFGAAALLAVAGLPIGFGATALVLELSAALGLGVSALPLLLALGLSAAIAAYGAVRVAAGILLHPGPPRPAAPALLGVVGTAAAVAGALVPGAFAGWLNGALGAPGTLADAGAAAASGPHGGWAGGYFAVAALLLGGGALAAQALTGARVRALEPAPAPAPALPPAPLPLRLFRRLRRPRQAVLGALPAVDAWIVQQPQLPLIAAGGLLAVLLIR